MCQCSIEILLKFFNSYLLIPDSILYGTMYSNEIWFQKSRPYFRETIISQPIWESFLGISMEVQLNHIFYKILSYEFKITKTKSSYDYCSQEEYGFSSWFNDTRARSQICNFSATYFFIFRYRISTFLWNGLRGTPRVTQQKFWPISLIFSKIIIVCITYCKL